ncbi:hypothetical protein K9M79_01005 [Candidatus Woesearchaeota archaeon]|nr:hypothetical protein [Candidatus Woesearchaeota archaeon]
MKNRFIATLITILIALLFVGSSYAVTNSEIRESLKVQANLDSMKTTVNDVLGDMPSQISSMIGENREYHARVGSSDMGIILKNGKIDSIGYGKPDKPTHRIDVPLSVVNQIVGADNQGSEVVKALIKGDIQIYELPPCDDDRQCEDNQVCTQDGCVDAFTLIVVPIGYSRGENDDFYGSAQPEVALFEKYAPVENMRVHYVNPDVCPDYTCNDVCVDCQIEARKCARTSGYIGIADKIVAISKGDVKTYIGNQPLMLCGCAGGIPADTSVSRARLFADGGVYCYNTVPHELGHQLGLYHVDSTGEEAGSCLGPNADDCSETNKASDIMGYGWPQDHFGPKATSYLTGILR